MNALTTKLRMGLKTGLRHAAAGAGWALVRLGDRRLVHRGGPRVLCYHGVCDDPPDEWSVTPAQLRAHMEIVAGEFQPVPLQKIVDHVLLQDRGAAGAADMERAVAVTFDDGFADVAQVAAPILAAHGVPGAAFVAPALLSGAGPDLREGVDRSYAPTRPFLTWDEVRALHGVGWTIGSHSLTHPRLSELGESESLRQLRGSKQALEDFLGVAVDLLAYPYGTAHTVSVRDQRLAAQCGYRAAFLDMTGPVRPGVDVMGLPRNKVLRGDSLAVLRASLRGELDVWRLIESRH